MAGWNHSKANWKPKVCVVCEEEFLPKSGVHKFCSESCKGKHKYQTGVVTTKSQYKEISGNWKRYLSRLLHSGGDKRKDLSVGILLSKLKSQNYKCALSGIELTCLLDVGTKYPFNASVDRVVAGGPYSEGNIQLVCRSLNSWRSDTSVEDFIEMCGKVYLHNKAKIESEV